MSTPLTVQDIVLLERIINSCQSRGAIKAPEMTQVGNIYDKLCKILQEIKEKADEEEKKKREEKLPTITEDFDEESKI